MFILKVKLWQIFGWFKLSPKLRKAADWCFSPDFNFLQIQKKNDSLFVGWSLINQSIWCESHSFDQTNGLTIVMWRLDRFQFHLRRNEQQVILVQWSDHIISLSLNFDAIYFSIQKHSSLLVVTYKMWTSHGHIMPTNGNICVWHCRDACNITFQSFNYHCYNFLGTSSRC